MERPLLFKACPELKGKVDWIPLGEYPTPVARLEGLCAAEGLRDFYIKRDDLSSPFYGGNKVRKLEYLLADALALGADTLVSIGGVQSNHTRQVAAVVAFLCSDDAAMMTGQDLNVSAGAVMY